MSDLVRLLGRDNVDKLSRAAGGGRLFIPKHYGKPPGGGRDTSARLDALVGPSLAVLLVFHFGDSWIYVPKAEGRTLIDAAHLKRLKRSNLSSRQIAQALGVTVRAVEKHEARRQVTERARKRSQGRKVEKVP